MLGMSKALHTNDSPLNLIDLRQIAKHTSLVQRETRGFSPLSIIVAFIKCLQKGDASFHHLAVEMSKLNVSSVCRGAIYKRVSDSMIAYFEGVLAALLTAQPMRPLKSRKAKKFERILIEDSTFVPMGAINSGNFPAFGNNQGCTAGFKLDLALDVLNNTVLHQSFSSARESDKKLGKQLVENIGEGDLVLRDMGYFSMESFREIEKKSAFWISRLPSSVTIMLENGDPLEKRLRARKNNFIDETVTVGLSEGFKARLVAVRAEDRVAQERRRSRKKVAMKFGNQPKNQSLIRDGWHIILTNLSADYRATELFDFYSLRWNIELKFKAWKQSLCLKPTLKRFTNYHHLACIALAALIQQLITHHIFARIIALSKRAISYEKLSEVISSHFGSLACSNLASNIVVEERHVRMDQRKRKSLHEKLLTFK